MGGFGERPVDYDGEGFELSFNARFLLAAAMHESAWGTSDIARIKHNLFGYNAYDRAPFRSASAYRTYAANIDASPARLQEVEDRLALLERLKKKHGPALADVIAKGDRLRRDLDEIEHATERAAELLKSGRCNVTEAAFEVGYSSLSHFSQAFHEMFGCCPGLYPLRTPTQQPPPSELAADD